MSARLLILIVVAGILVATAAFKGSAPSAKTGDDGPRIRPLGECDLLVTQQEVPGDEPDELPSLDDFTINLEVDRTSVKNRIVFTVSEAHGYYVDGLDIRFWWQPDGKPIDSDDSPFSFVYHMNNYIKANETFKDCLTVTNPELNNIGGDMGATSNWGAQVEDYRRVRLQNPEKFPCAAIVEEHCR